jgi:hypothetical protein
MLTRGQYHTFRPFRFLNLFGVGAEVGTYRADFSVAMLSKRQVRKLYLIDPYAYFGDSQKMTQEMLDDAKRKAAKRVDKYGDKVCWIYQPSHEAARAIPEKLDFVYIDGDHRYEGVKQDIADYWPLVDDGGIFGGHDFYRDWPGVIQAVTEFSVVNGLQLFVESPDWWIVKPYKCYST